MKPVTPMSFQDIPFKEEWVDSWGNELGIFQWAINNPFLIRPNTTFHGMFVKDIPNVVIGGKAFYNPGAENRSIRTFKLTRIDDRNGVSVFYYESRSFDNYFIFCADICVHDNGQRFGKAHFKRNNIVFSEFLIAKDVKGNDTWIKGKQLIEIREWDWNFIPATSEQFFFILGNELKHILRHYEDSRISINQYIKECKEETYMGDNNSFLNDKEKRLFFIFKKQFTKPDSPLMERCKTGASLNSVMKLLEKLRKELRK